MSRFRLILANVLLDIFLLKKKKNSEFYGKKNAVSMEIKFHIIFFLLINRRKAFIKADHLIVIKLKN